MRNKVFIFFVFLFCVASICQAFTLNIQDNFKFIYHIIDSSGNHVSGQTVTLKIQRASDGYWYDFSDDVFKNSGWTQKSVNLSEDTVEGMYYYIYNPPLSESSPNEYIFLVNNSDLFYGDHQSMIVSYGIGDWTGGEKTLIKEALGVNDGSVNTGGDLDSIYLEIKKSRGR